MATGCISTLRTYFLLLAIGTLVTSAITEVPNGKNTVCADGTYQHNGKTCCLCAPGQKVLKHCENRPNDVECGFCEVGKTYREEANSETSCEPCDSCSHPNANLEVVEQCTTSRNAKCGCQKGFYCNSEAGSCVVCHSCDECKSTGIKIACNGTSNTVCNENQGLSSGAIFSIIILVLMVLAVPVVWIIWKKKTRKSKAGDKSDSEELEGLNEADISPYLADIARILGWGDVMYIARKSQMEETIIESCRLNHPNNIEESTFQLLKQWSEMKGKGGLKSLLQILQELGKKDQKERILKLTKDDPTNESNNPV